MISHNLLQLMGSNFNVVSAPNKGTTFSFELNLEVSPQPEQFQSHKARGLSPDLADIGRSLVGTRVLVVEDNAINQQVVVEFLKLSGIATEVANNGKEAMERLEHGHFDAILMDVHMPVMDGFEATHLIRQTVDHAKTPVIAMTAGVTQEERESCRMNGMDDVVIKPIVPDQLIGILKHYVRHPQKIPARPDVTQTENIQASTSGQNSLEMLPGFDLHNLLAMLGNNQVLALQLLISFADDMVPIVASLKAALASGDLGTARELAHKIKGAAGNVGATDLHQLSGTLELEIKAGQSDPASFATFHAEFERVLSVIAGLHHIEQATDGNLEAFKVAAMELDQLLAENDFIPHQLLEDLSKTVPGEKRELFGQLQQHIRHINYPKAREMLHTLTSPTSANEL